MTKKTIDLSFVALLDWVEGRCSAEQAAATSVAVAEAGPATRETVRWMREFIASAERCPLHEPPPVLTQRLHRVFARSSAETEQLPQVRATLFFDSRRDRMLQNARGAMTGPADAVQLVYACAAGDVTLAFTPSSDGQYELTGQVLLDDESLEPAFDLTVQTQSTKLRSVDGNTSGEFALDSVPADVTSVLLDNGYLQIALDVQLQAAL